MSKVIHVNQQQFEMEVLRSPVPVVIDFFATWCAPCRALGPILDRMADEFDGQVKFVKVDSDEEPGLAGTYKVTGLPTLVFVADGVNVGQSAGLPSENELRKHLQEWVQSKVKKYN